MNDPLPATYPAFIAELREVEEILASTADELGGPLGELVQGQVHQAQPSIRGALVLSIARTEDANTPPTNDGSPEDNRTRTSKQARINLAAALEMLHIALNIHRLLVEAVSTNSATNYREREDDNLDRAFVGSTILAGDYCFSRAAQLAAYTDNPAVVALFADALQTISETRLRHQFQHEQTANHAASDTPDAKLDTDTLELLVSGAKAAAVLAGLDQTQQMQALQIAHDVATRLGVDEGIQSSQSADDINAYASDEHLAAQSQLLFHWLLDQLANN